MWQNVLTSYAYAVNVAIIWYFIIFNVGYLVLLIASVPEILKKYKEVHFGKVQNLLQNKIAPPVTIIVPAYNEKGRIISTVYSLLKSRYPKIEIIIVNDGSKDTTMLLLEDTFKLTPISPITLQQIKTAEVMGQYVSTTHPNLTVIDKVHSGKSDTLNAGINACMTPYFATVDGDTLLDPDAIAILMYSMLSEPHTIAEGGSINVVNACEVKGGEVIVPKISASPIVALQTNEFLRAFLFGRTGYHIFGGPIVLSGALTLLERHAVVTVGGYAIHSPGEDMEIIVRLHEYMRKNKYPYHIEYTPAAVAWSEEPTDMNRLWAQRDRWQRGLIDSLIRHMKMLFNPQYGPVGFFSFPFNLFGEFFGATVEILGYAAVIISMYFNIIDWQFALLFFMVSWGFSTVLTMASALISFVTFNRYKRLGDAIYLLFLVLLENVGYRQVLAVCRFVASIRYLLQRIGLLNRTL